MTELIETTISDNTNRKLRPFLPNFNDEKKACFALCANSSLIFFFWHEAGGYIFSYSKIVPLKGGSFLTY